MTTVTVTQEDLDRGVRADCKACPVALAMTRALGVPVEVGRRKWWVNEPFRVRNLPEDVMDLIARFDNEAPVEPFSFSVQADPPSTAELTAAM